MATREEVITNLAREHRMSEAMAGQLVDDAGNVDSEKLSLLLIGVAWGKNPASNVAPGAIKALEDAYHAAKAKVPADVPSMISIKNQLGKLGVIV